MSTSAVGGSVGSGVASADSDGVGGVAVGSEDGAGVATEGGLTPGLDETTGGELDDADLVGRRLCGGALEPHPARITASTAPRVSRRLSDGAMAHPSADG
jgi:hypothetical protein